MGSDSSMNWLKISILTEQHVAKKLALILGEDRQEITIEITDKEDVSEEEKAQVKAPTEVPTEEKILEESKIEEIKAEETKEQDKVHQQVNSVPAEKPLETVKEDEALETVSKTFHAPIFSVPETGLGSSAWC